MLIRTHPPSSKTLLIMLYFQVIFKDICAAQIPDDKAFLLKADNQFHLPGSASNVELPSDIEWCLPLEKDGAAIWVEKLVLPPRNH